MALAKDAAQQVYRSVFAILTGDAALSQLLGATGPEDRKVYQSVVDFNSLAGFKDALWITYNIPDDHPYDVEQMQDVHAIILDVHIWQRGPGSDKAEMAEKRVRELLDNADLSTANLFAWYCHAAGYTKTYEATPSVWHLTSTYHALVMALEADS